MGMYYYYKIRKIKHLRVACARPEKSRKMREQKKKKRDKIKN